MIYKQFAHLMLWTDIHLVLTSDLSSQTQGDINESISFSTLDGWVMKFNRDGSASISYGSLPIDQARVAAGVFHLQFVLKSISHHLKDSSISSKRVAVNTFKYGQISSIATYADDLLPFQSLCREVIQNASFIDIERFRGLVAQHPPFGIEDLVLNREQATKPQPIISEFDDTKSEEPQKQNVVVETNPAPKPLPVVQPAQKKAPEAKPPSMTPSEQPASSMPWSIIVVVIVAACGLLWLLVKKRK